MKLLTTDELADKLDVSPRTLQDWRHRGEGPPFVKLGDCVRYKWSAVEQWMADRTYSRTGEVPYRAG